MSVLFWLFLDNSSSPVMYVAGHVCCTTLWVRYKNLTKNIAYITSHVGGEKDPMPLFEQAMEMLAAGRLAPSAIMTHTFSYRDFPEAYKRSSNYEDGVIKSLITWTDETGRL